MDAVEFLREKHRMCRTHKNCNDCRLNGTCYGDEIVGIEQDVVEIVEEWSKEHIENTRMGAFLKLFPNVEFKDGVPDFCPLKFESHFNCDTPREDCCECRRNYWLEEIE